MNFKKKKKKRPTLRMEGTPVNQHLPAWPTGGVDMDAVSLHVEPQSLT